MAVITGPKISSRAIVMSLSPAGEERRLDVEAARQMRRTLAAAGERGAFLARRARRSCSTRSRCAADTSGPTTTPASRGSPILSARAALGQRGGELVVDRLPRSAAACRRCRSARCGRSTPARRRAAPCRDRRRRRRCCGDLPPSSSSVRFMRRAAASWMRSPTAVLPVNEIMSTSGDSTSASPISGPEPQTKFTTPGGSTASTMRQSSATPSGSTGAGFTTTVLPHASAGPILPAQLVIGKLYGRDAGDHADRLAHGDAEARCRARRRSRGGTGVSRRLRRQLGVLGEPQRAPRRPAATRRPAAARRSRRWSGRRDRAPPRAKRAAASRRQRAALGGRSCAATGRARTPRAPRAPPRAPARATPPARGPPTSSVAGSITGYVPPAAGTHSAADQDRR